MALISILNFKGELPLVIPRLLPDGFAQIARNTRLSNGAIGPVLDEKTVFTFGSDRHTFAKLNGDWYGWDEQVDIAQGPVATDRIYITGDGAPKMRIGPDTYDLALPAPATAPTLEQVVGTVDEDLVETITYAYTWVTSLDEESAPSPLPETIEWSTGVTIRVAGFEAPPAGRLVDRIRIYMSQTSGTGITDLYFVGEIEATDTFFDHDLTINPTQEILPSTGWTTPPDDLEGIITMPNGMMAGFSGKDLYFCEPYLPHAWPAAYSLNTDYPIVGLASFGSVLCVMTQGTPYLVQGTHPDSMSMQRVEQNLPCVSRRGIVDMGYSAVYPSTEGLVEITATGAQIISKGLYTRPQWSALNPASFTAGRYDGRYFYSCTPEGHTARRLYAVDMSGQFPYLIDMGDGADSFFHEIETGELYLLRGNVVSRWEGDTRYRVQKWRSKLYHITRLETFGVLQVDGEEVAPSTHFTARVYADGALRETITQFNRPVRMRAGAYARRWEIEVETNLNVTGIHMAGDMSEIQGAA